MSKHTPGPWKTGIGETDCCNIYRDDDLSSGIATTDDSDYPQEVEDANARLIAAAPIGYELAALIKRLESSPMSRDFIPPEVQLLAREFLAKAEGGRS